MSSLELDLAQDIGLVQCQLGEGVTTSQGCCKVLQGGQDQHSILYGHLWRKGPETFSCHNMGGHGMENVENHLSQVD